mgnify:CR=1 FL=1
MCFQPSSYYLNIDNNEVVKTDLTPKELLDIAGYDLYECKTESDIQAFKKYYGVLYLQNRS